MMTIIACTSTVLALLVLAMLCRKHRAQRQEWMRKHDLARMDLSFALMKVERLQRRCDDLEVTDDDRA